MITKFFTVRYHRSRVLSNLWEIGTNYLKTEFLLDFIVLLALLIVRASGEHLSETKYFSYLLLLKIP